MAESVVQPHGTIDGDVPAQRCHCCGQPLGYWATDKLTGLLDRWGWDEQAPPAVTRARQHGQSSALLIVDLDLFKNVNDTFGHLAGDAVLQHAAGALRGATRSGDVLGRYGGHGGDEFLVLLPETSLPDAIAVAHRIQAGIRTMEVSTRTAQGTVVITGCTASIGVTAHPAGSPVEVLDLLLAADVALFEAKAGGRDQVRAARFSKELTRVPPRR
jgi:diguanylate cyclase (GGDEF)-like protein